MGLLAFNAARFGSVLETGRPAEDFGFDAPWTHVIPLLASWGKGLPEIAVLALGAGLGLDRLLARGPGRTALAVAVVCGCITEQVWLASGEIFSWCHRWRAILAEQGHDVFAGDLLYHDFDLSPFAPGFVLDGVPGPALARAFDIAPAWFAAVTAGLLCAASAAAIVRGRPAGTPGP